MVGLASAFSASGKEERSHTITLLEREPYTLHCIVVRAATDGLMTSPILPADKSSLNGVTALTTTND